MSEEARRREVYDRLHEESELRFPLEDYAPFFELLNVPRDGEGLCLLDIACGQGFFLEQAEALSPRLATHGLDFSPKGLALAEPRLSRTELKEGYACELPYAEGRFDYCVNLGSLEHFDKPADALSEMARVLKPTGKALVIVPNQYYAGSIWRMMAYGEEDEQGQEGVTQFRTIQSWKRLFGEASLDVTGVEGYNGYHHIAWHFRRENGVITEQEKSWRGILDTFVKPIIPLNLSQCFVFTLRRQV
jgi:SAM-dependent methyltransferase